MLEVEPFPAPDLEEGRYVEPAERQGEQLRQGISRQAGESYLHKTSPRYASIPSHHDCSLCSAQSEQSSGGGSIGGEGRGALGADVEVGLKVGLEHLGEGAGVGHDLVELRTRQINYDILTACFIIDRGSTQRSHFRRCHG